MSKSEPKSEPKDKSKDGDNQEIITEVGKWVWDRQKDKLTGGGL